MSLTSNSPSAATEAIRAAGIDRRADVILRGIGGFAGMDTDGHPNWVLGSRGPILCRALDDRQAAKYGTAGRRKDDVEPIAFSPDLGPFELRNGLPDDRAVAFDDTRRSHVAALIYELGVAAQVGEQEASVWARIAGPAASWLTLSACGSVSMLPADLTCGVATS
jgi:hypothetical protein